MMNTFPGQFENGDFCFSPEEGVFEFWPGPPLVFPAANHNFIFSLSPLILTTLPYLTVNVFQNISKACSTQWSKNKHQLNHQTLYRNEPPKIIGKK